MISDQIKTGVDRAPHRSLLYALGLTEEELEICFRCFTVFGENMTRLTDCRGASQGGSK